MDKSCELNWFSFVEVIKDDLFNLEEREELHDNRAKPTSILAQRLEEN